MDQRPCCLSEEGTQVADKHTKRYSALYVIREMEIKTIR